jgi:trigger factor
MKVKEKKIDNETLQLTVEVSAEDVNNALHQAQLNFANTMGMRPVKNKTVAQVAEEQMGIKDLDSLVTQGAIESFVPLALDKKNIIPAYPPQPTPKTQFKRGQAFIFEMQVTLKPNYELTSYEPVEIKVERFKADEGAVDKQLAEIADRYKLYVDDPDADTSKPVEKGDHICIAMHAFEDGVELKNLATEGRTYTVGEGYMPEGFENEVLGMKIGETKTFTFDGPDFDEDFNEIIKQVEATVTVLGRQKEEAPVIDDAWVQANMPMYRNLEELRNSISQGLDAQARDQYDAYVQQLAAAEAAKRFEGKIADEVYESTRDTLVSNIRQDLKSQNMTWENFVEQNGGEQQMSMMIMLQTRQMLVQGYALDAVFRHEKLTLTDDDIEATCHAMNPQVNPKQLRQQFEQNGRSFALRESAERLKANKFLVEHAKITYTD